MSEPHPYCAEHDQPLEWCAHHVLSTGDPAGALLQNIFGGPGHRDGPPFTHTLKLPETEEEMAAEPPPSFTLEEAG